MRRHVDAQVQQACEGWGTLPAHARAKVSFNSETAAAKQREPTRRHFLQQDRKA
jgi:hypothetical protein